MHFAAPLFLFGLLALGVHLALYFLRARHPPRVVSSLMLWRKVAQAAGEGRAFRIPRLPPLFLLEALALAALALAAATPFLRRGGTPAVTVVVDPSLSMTARDASGRAVHERAAEALRRDLGSPPFVRLVAADPHAPRLVGLLSPAEAVAYLRDASHFAEASDTLPAAIALADRLRGPGTPILCLSDHVLPQDSLPPATRLLSFGAPLPNAAIAFARRSRAESGADALIAEVRVHPETDSTPSLVLEAAGNRTVLVPEPGTRRYRCTLPPGTGPVRLSLPDDALSADNAVTLLPPDSESVPVSLEVSSPALRRVVARALAATGMAVTNAASPRLLVTDRDPPPGIGMTVLLLVPPGAPTRMSAAPPLVESGDPLLEGLDFTGLAWTLGDAPLAGSPLVSTGISPVLARDGSLLRLAATPTDPFFRSPAWPSLVWNLLRIVAAESATVPEQIVRNGPESDLSGCSEGRVSGSEAPLTAENSASTLPTALLALAALLLLGIRVALLRRAPSPAGVALCALAALLLLAALFRPALPLPKRSGMIIAVADRSSSLPTAEREEQTALIEALVRRRSPGERLGIVSFGVEAAVEQIPSEAAFDGFHADLDPEGSDLAGALRLAAGLVPADTPARIVLLSDGRASLSEADTPAIPVDFHLQQAPPSVGPELLRLDAPTRLRPDEGLLATAWVLSPTNVAATYRFRCGTNLVASGTVRLAEGLTPLSFRDAPRPAGTAAYSLVLAPVPADGAAPDPDRELRARFLVTRESRRPVLAVPPAPGTAPLGGALAAAGFETRTVADPTTFDFSPATLSAHSALVLENVPASALGPVALSNVAAWVAEAGGGLVLTGGRRSFGQGGYFRSALDPVLPVTMEMRNERRKFSMAVAIALDRSGSMAASVGGGRTKMDLANLGSAEVLNLLSDRDELAVFAVDSEAHEVLPLVSASEARKRVSSILGIQSMGGGIFVYEALAAAVESLKDSRASIRHVLLFSDACDSEEPGDYTTLVGLARDEGVTVSVVGLGSPTDPDADLLRDIAEIGGGECFFSADAGEIPRLFAQDTILLARNALVDEPTVPAFTTALPLLSDTLPASAPALGGHNLCYAHPAATVVAVSSSDATAPLVAFRPVGAGWTVAFTGEANGEFSGEFAQWEHVPEFYAALLRRAASADGSLPPGMTLVPRLDGSSLAVDLYVAEDAPFIGTPSLRVLRTRATGTTAETLRFAWTAADRLSAEVPLRHGETVLPVLRLEESDSPLPLPPVCLPFSLERKPDPEGRGEKTLESLARATGGRRLLQPADAWSLLPHGTRSVPLAPWLYLTASALLLLDILCRRLRPGIRNPETPRSRPLEIPKSRNPEIPSPRKPENPEIRKPALPDSADSADDGILAKAKSRARRRL